MEKVTLTVNGFTQSVLVESHETILDTLRNRLNLTGTKNAVMKVHAAVVQY